MVSFGDVSCGGGEGPGTSPTGVCHLCLLSLQTWHGSAGCAPSSSRQQQQRAEARLRGKVFPKQLHCGSVVGVGPERGPPSRSTCECHKEVPCRWALVSYILMGIQCWFTLILKSCGFSVLSGVYPGEPMFAYHKGSCPLDTSKRRGTGEDFT